ncbi:PTI1-like tyrosine-protein kinase [Apostasia shenzhenica]|uniref:non-specific serine/threonine protein kinase n=1 Tax=Apostasia shenzhenica TaxID=1088818 RepID=A0A2I0AYX1_9ASPA|nr:PTI1-like tyrosine-protein kinase [Apostasia shenzhenica]
MKLMSNLFCLSSSEKKKEKRNCSSMASRGSHDGYSWEVFKLKEILQATNNFSENYKLGEGGFGTVYWGRTASGEEIAVKRLKAMSPKAEMEFAVEVEVLARVRHKNLLGLRGYYAGGSERLIVYEYMPNHSLVSHLHGHFAGEARLDWPRRMAVAVSSAKGLA